MNLPHRFVKDVAEKLLMPNGRPNLFALYLRVSEECVVAPLTPKEAQYVAVVVGVVGRRRLQLKQCYMNSQLLLTSDYGNKLRYYEGWFASTELGIPIHHAWLTLNGKVVDLTANIIRTRNSNRVDEKFEYFGVKIPKPLVMRNMLDTEVFGAVTENRLLAKKVFRLKS